MSSWKLIRATIYQALVAYLLLTHFNHFKYLREVGTWDGKGSTRRQTSVTFSQVLSESILYCALITLWNQRIERHHFIPNEMQICTNIHCAHSSANCWLLTPDVSHEIAKDFVYKQFHPINYLFGFHLKGFHHCLSYCFGAVADKKLPWASTSCFSFLYETALPVSRKARPNLNMDSQEKTSKEAASIVIWLDLCQCLLATLRHFDR